MESSNQTDQFPYMVDDSAPGSLEENDKEELLDSDIKSKTIIKPTRCRGCTVYIEPLLFMVMLSEFPLFILTPQYVLGRELKKLTGNDNITVSSNSCSEVPYHNLTDPHHYDPVHGNYTLAQSAASLFQLQSTLVSSIPAMFVVMFIGPYSDKKGRKIAIILPLLGSLFSVLNTFLNVYFQWPIELLLVGNFIYGCTGYWTTLFMGCLAFVTDVTTREQRQFRIVLTEICMMTPSILSSFGSGFFLETFGFPLLYFIVFLINIVLLLYAIFVIPETVRPDPDAKFFSTVFIRKSISIFTRDTQSKRRWKLLVLLAALFFSLIVGIGGRIDTLFVMNRPLCWGTELIGIQTSLSMAIGVVGSAIIAKILNRFLRDAWISAFGGVMNVAQNIFKFFVSTTAMMFGSSAFSLSMVLFTPTIRAMFSKLVQPNEVGAVFAGVAFVEVLCGLVGNAIFNPIYSATQEIGLPSFVYLVMAGFYLIGLIIMITYAVLTRRDASMGTLTSEKTVEA